MPENTEEKKRAVVFVDGNNFYHNSKYMFKSVGLKPFDIDFLKLSEALCEYFGVKHVLTRYYNSIPNIRSGEERYWKHINFLKGLESIPKFLVITRKLQTHSTRELLKERDEIISGLGLCEKCKPVIQLSCKDCIGSEKVHEKGIDVQIAIDIIEHAIKDKCDCIILFSGDADFIPALKLAEEYGKKAFSSSVWRGYSFELRNNFENFIIGNDFLIEKCLKDKKLK